jgi:hypothetical protein
VARPCDLERLLERPVTYFVHRGGFPVPATLRLSSRNFGTYDVVVDKSTQLRFNCADVVVEGDTIINVA